MSTSHFWFESGRYALFAHADLPQERARRGVVIVSPFGWEDVCSHRPLRFVAHLLASRGIAVLRYDLPGTGDSSGSALDSGLVEASIRSVADAAAQLREAARVDEVAVLGIRMGGLVAAAAAGRGSDIQDLILWGTASSGRNELRELRAYAEMERWETETDAAPPQSGLEAGGFLLTPETQRDLEALDISRMTSLAPRRVLILSRDNLAPDSKLIRAFESAGCDVRRETGAGYSQMMAVPNEALPPESTASRIADFLNENSASAGRPRIASGVNPWFDNGNAREAVYTIDDSIFGILSTPLDPRSDVCLLLLNAGGVRHIGPNRMWTDAARRAAAKGIASFRFDLGGIGESDGEPCLDIPALYQERLVEQVEAVMQSLSSAHGFCRFAAIGLCAGAFWAFHAAIRNREICSAMLLNPRLFFWDPEVDRRRMMRRGVKGLISPGDWWRLIRGGVQAADLKRAARTVLARSRESVAGALSRRQIPARKMAKAWNKIARNQTRLTLVFAEGEPLLREMQDERQMPPLANPRIRLERLPASGHTFRPLWARELVNGIIDRELDSVVSENRLDRVLETK